VRPAIGWGRAPGATAEAVREAHARIEAAKSEQDRAVALCEAAALVGPRGARGLFLRAMRADPASVAVIEQAAAGLSRRPRALEALLWRRLASTPWNEAPAASRAALDALHALYDGPLMASRAALDALHALYDGPLRNPVRAQAMAHARDAISAPAGSS
jgi:hypothetical protein